MTRVKICGIKTVEDGRAALTAGADMLGFIFYRPVSRYLAPEVVAEIVSQLRSEHNAWQAVGVFVDEPVDNVNAIAEACDLDLVQLAGDESPDYCRRLEHPAIKVLRVRDCRWTTERLAEAKAGYQVERFMIDSHVSGFYGGTGVAADWQDLSGLLDGHILAGGLHPDNVASALAIAHPWGVDVSSGVEIDGKKDATLIRHFLAAVQSCPLAHRSGRG
ncbi:MAG: N-(5'-phosphoribosyl)anthranilate isomerase [Chloroflexota bacterium]